MVSKKKNTNNLFNFKNINYKSILIYFGKVLGSSIFIIILFIIGDYLNKLIQKMSFTYHDKLDKKKIEFEDKDKDKDKEKNNLSIIAGMFVKYTIYFIGIYAVFHYLGFNTSLILAAFGTCGVAIALGLQGSLSNLVAGILITINGNYRIGEIIETNVDKGEGINQSLIGKVIDYDLFTFHIREINTGLLFNIPNNQLWESVVANYNHYDNKLYLTVKIIVSENNNLKNVLSIIKNVCENDKKIIKENSWPSPFINVTNSDNICGVTILVRFLTELKNYPNIVDTIQNDIILKLKENKINFVNCSKLFSSNQ